jgi:hypothetical protein
MTAKSETGIPTPRSRKGYTMIVFTPQERAHLEELITDRNAKSPVKWDMTSLIRDLARRAKK